jgi:putative acetyltransferase
VNIAVADLADPRVQELIAFHQQAMLEGSPAGLCFAVDLSGLANEAVTVWAAEVGDRIAAVGALKRLDAASAEVKSMRTHPDFLRQGCAAALLETIITHACAEGYAALSLETGTGPAFEPALTLYRRRGFVNGPAFADYALTELQPVPASGTGLGDQCAGRLGSLAMLSWVSVARAAFIAASSASIASCSANRRSISARRSSSM